MCIGMSNKPKGDSSHWVRWGVWEGSWDAIWLWWRVMLKEDGNTNIKVFTSKPLESVVFSEILEATLDISGMTKSDRLPCLAPGTTDTVLFFCASLPHKAPGNNSLVEFRASGQELLDDKHQHGESHLAASVLRPSPSPCSPPLASRPLTCSQVWNSRTVFLSEGAHTFPFAAWWCDTDVNKWPFTFHIHGSQTLRINREDSHCRLCAREHKRRTKWAAWSGRLAPCVGGLSTALSWKRCACCL